MKTLLILSLLMAPVVAGGALALDDPQQPASGEASPVRWLDDLDRATALAAESDRPLMIVFR